MWPEPLNIIPKYQQIIKYITSLNKMSPQFQMFPLIPKSRSSFFLSLFFWRTFPSVTHYSFFFYFQFGLYVGTK